MIDDKLNIENIYTANILDIEQLQEKLKKEIEDCYITLNVALYKKDYVSLSKILPRFNNKPNIFKDYISTATEKFIYGNNYSIQDVDFINTIISHDSFLNELDEIKNSFFCKILESTLENESFFKLAKLFPFYTEKILEDSIASLIEQDKFYLMNYSVLNFLLNDKKIIINKDMIKCILTYDANDLLDTYFKSSFYNIYKDRFNQQQMMNFSFNHCSTKCMNYILKNYNNSIDLNINTYVSSESDYKSLSLESHTDKLEYILNNFQWDNNFIHKSLNSFVKYQGQYEKLIVLVEHIIEKSSLDTVIYLNECSKSLENRKFKNYISASCNKILLYNHLEKDISDKSFDSKNLVRKKI